jgi:ApaG protein
MYSKTTNSILVVVETQFLEDHSTPDEDHYVWAYHVRIENVGSDSVKLKTRQWHITDARGQQQNVSGEGVIGEQPVLDPGDAYEYASGVPLETPSGIMGGSYQMQSGAGKLFDVEIPTFSLDSPYETSSVH